MAASKALHFLLSFLIIAFTGGLCYKAAVSTQQALNEANQALFAKTATGKLTDASMAALTEKLNSYKLAAKTLGDMYLQEGVAGWNVSTGDSTGYLNAAFAMPKAWITELKYVYISYKVTDVTDNVWGDVGCEVTDEGNPRCYYTDQNGVSRSYNDTDFSGPGIDPHQANAVNESYITFVAKMKKDGPQKNGDWQAPYIYIPPDAPNTKYQLATFTYPIQYDISGNCVAAAQIDFQLSASESILLQHQPDKNAHVVLYNSFGSSGAFVATTNQSVTPVNNDEVFPAIGTAAEMPYRFVSDFLTTLTAKLGNQMNILNVTGNFIADGTYYEASTYDMQWTIAVEVPMADYYTTFNKWSPKVGLNKDDIKSVWSDTNTIGIFGIGASIFVFAVINIIVGCCCADGPAKRRAGLDDYYVSSTQAAA